ncbi:MAG TPA: polyribonucleotide nucleotidyltransferase [Perlabentimonas sp.]|nr:polyribonucleotide nucleotidyltransferase [Bacteroidales bacterium]MDD4672911.1 polyribonucleotide nucleotidyltransferase [Bacteroidales bacterium]HZJ74209.1 polyribonucleotide nucleotidyltransferase [Perlabentimonas sp.]
MFNVVTKSIDLGDGRSITIETGKLARQADGSVVIRMGRTMMLANVVSAKEARDDVDFMPLSVDYKEKFAAGGRFPGGFLKREARPTDYEVLVARLVDRALRPLFPSDFHADTFVTINLISADKDTPPDALAGLAASAALAISDVPFNGPISEVRVVRIDGKFVINPTFSQIEEADIDMMVGATYDNILMVEGEMDEISEAEMLEAIKYAHEEIKKHCQVQMDLAKELGVVKREYCHEKNDEELRDKVKEFCYDKVYQVAKSTLSKHERGEAFAAIKEEFLETLPEDEREEKASMVSRYYHDVEKFAMRNMILDERIRLDGRKTDEIRPIECEVDFLPSAHGSALFTRGETQSLTTITLGTKLDEKIVDEVLHQGTDKFLLHYNFPPFSTGDARPYRGVSRREIGHGNLAHRALKKMMPTGEDNPYTIRVVSDILESNGSSSMATVCAGTLALMDAGIKLQKPVSGIAMGLISEPKGARFAILSDILGDEDHLGDMDFKVTGTKDGITATQMDIKVDGLPYEVLFQALNQAREGRMHILDKMTAVIAEPNDDLKAHAPRIEKFSIARDMIGTVIGPGGKIIQEIQRTTGATINIEEVDNQGTVTVFADNVEARNAAVKWIKSIAVSPEEGEIYTGRVKSILPFGAFIEIVPGKDGLLHISEIDWKRIEKVEDVLKEGDMVEVKLIEVDRKTGKLKLSRKALLPKPENRR